jgi:hypothetical protein
MQFERDPVSEQFDAAARRLLRRAYDNAGDWTGTYLAQPSPLWRAWALAHGINLNKRDRWGEVRWVRAFKRSVYWNLAWYGYAGQLGDAPRIGKGDGKALRWQTGKLVYKTGWPARRWAIRVMVVPGGLAAEHHARQLPARKRYTEDPELQSKLEDRDWQ